MLIARDLSIQFQTLKSEEQLGSKDTFKLSRVKNNSGSEATLSDQNPICILQVYLIPQR
jgi:hypothetical protein